MSLLLGSEVTHCVAELDGIALGVTDVDRTTEFMIDFQHSVAVGSPPLPVCFEIFETRRVESNMVDPPRQPGTFVEVGAEFGADGLVVNLPKRDHALFARG